MHALAFAESIQLFPDGTIFIHIALILGMIWLLNRTLFRPINAVLVEREQQKGQDGGPAGPILKDVEEKEARYNRELLAARTEGYALIEKDQKAAVAKRDEKIAAAKLESAAALDAGKAELDKQDADARAAIAANAEKIADKIAATILNS